MLNLIPAIYRAWQAGQIIRNPAKWKSSAEVGVYVTSFVEAVFVILLFFFPGIKEYLTVEMSALIGTIITSILGVILIVIGRITTKKEVGLHVLLEDKPEDKPNQGRREDDVKLAEADRQAYFQRNAPTASKLGQGNRKVTPQGQDDL